MTSSAVKSVAFFSEINRHVDECHTRTHIMLLRLRAMRPEMSSHSLNHKKSYGSPEVRTGLSSAH